MLLLLFFQVHLFLTKEVLQNRLDEQVMNAYFYILYLSSEVDQAKSGLV
jgi:hypothetical protein